MAKAGKKSNTPAAQPAGGNVKKASAVFTGKGGGRAVPRIFERPRERRHDAPGRPSSLALVRAEAQRQVSAGPLPKKSEQVSGFARELVAWLRKTYPDFPQMEPKSLENGIRDIWRLRQKSI
jgi:hypothetical protein